MPPTVTETGAFTPANRSTLPVKTHFLATLPASALQAEPAETKDTSHANLAGLTTRSTYDSYIAICSRIPHVVGPQAQKVDMWELGTRDEIKAGWIFSGKRGDLEMFLPKLGLENDVQDLDEVAALDPLTGQARADTTWYTFHSSSGSSNGGGSSSSSNRSNAKAAEASSYLPISIFSPLSKLQPVTATLRTGPDPDLFLIRIRPRYPNELVSDRLYLGSAEGSILRIQIEKKSKHPLAVAKDAIEISGGLQPPKVLWYSSLTVPGPMKAITAMCTGGGILYAMSIDGSIRCLNEHGGSKIGFPVQLYDDGTVVTAICIDPYAKRFFSASEEGLVTQWAVGTDNRPIRNKVIRTWRVTGDGGKVTAICSTHGRVFTAVDKEGGLVREWALVGEEPEVRVGEGRRPSEVLPMYDSGEIRVPEMQKSPSGTLC
ncbi:hypothetical protein HDV00_000802 [Rhizophlyctis rosea]|nr:hypothetical protein HDV00_000802 [Rhizophlyctis rosea]